MSSNEMGHTKQILTIYKSQPNNKTFRRKIFYFRHDSVINRFEMLRIIWSVRKKMKKKCNNNTKKRRIFWIFVSLNLTFSFSLSAEYSRWRIKHNTESSECDILLLLLVHLN